MRDKLLMALIMATAMVISTVAVKADVPTLINYQGVLLDSDGHPVITPANITFTLYDAPSDGSVIWQETQLVEFDEDGCFNVILGGGTTPVTDDVFDDPVRWLGVQVEEDAELEPRTRIVSVAYAHRISTIDGAAGGTIDGDLQATGTITSGSSIIIDGNNSMITSTFGVIGFDNEDIQTSGRASIGPGNTYTGDCVFVAGHDNVASGNHSTVCGGSNNLASGDHGVISGGAWNDASGDYSAVGGGSGNTASGQGSVIAGGYAGTASNENATIGGGWHNVASGIVSTVAGGQEDTASGTFSVIAGGQRNAASYYGSAVGGGIANKAQGYASVISGGWGNQCPGEYASVIGGIWNTAGGNNSTVTGGSTNNAGGAGASIGGGINNSANGGMATVPGGGDNSAEGPYSFAAGRRAKAYDSGAFVWADDTDADFASTGEDQFLIRASGGVGIGIDNPTSALHVNGEAKCVVGGVEFFMVPRGAIIMWSGTLASIPSGWALCDGTNGTPNLSDRFIYSVHADENPGGIGGASSHNHTVPIPGTALYVPGLGAAAGGTYSTSSASNLPPYFKLAFIMKL